MIIPIFIPRFDNDDCDRKHGYGCKCPECLEKEKWDNKPKEYYKYRYAIPNNFIVKNILFGVICWSIAFFGLFMVISPALFLEFTPVYYWILPLSVVFGCFIVICAYLLGEKLIKYDFQCEQKIYIEIRDSYINPEKWEDKIKTLNIPKGFILTKEKSGWRYK